MVPLLGVWESAADIDFDALPKQFVLKANAGCAMNLIVTDKAQLDIEKTRKQLHQWLCYNYSLHAGFELQYRDIPRKIMAESYLGSDDTVWDYKFMCFDGEIAFVWVDVDRTEHHARQFFDLDWNVKHVGITSFPITDKEIKKPDNFDEMIRIVKILSAGFAHVRVDLYNVQGQIYFGEMTFTTANGMHTFASLEDELAMGDCLHLPEKKPIPLWGENY